MLKQTRLQMLNADKDEHILYNIQLAENENEEDIVRNLQLSAYGNAFNTIKNVFALPLKANHQIFSTLTTCQRSFSYRKQQFRYCSSMAVYR